VVRDQRCHIKWYERESDFAWSSPLPKVQAPKHNPEPIPGVSLEDVQRMADACINRGWYTRRDRAAIIFLFDTGVRRSEFVALNLQDIDMDSGAVQVLNGKGSKDRVTFFSDMTRVELRRYLRGRSSEPGDRPLWLGRDRERMSVEALRGIIEHAAERAGLATVPSPHDFRRGFAVNMLRNGADLLTVSRLLGHESLEVTKRYLALVEDDLSRVHKATSPADRLKLRR